MAKKKPESSDKSPATKKSSTRKATKTTPTPSDVPMIDTNFAAEAAARMLANRASLHSAAAQGGTSAETPAAPQPDSGAFKKFKENLHKPKISNSLLDPAATTNQKKTNLHSAFNKQTGHNQTYGNFNRAGVPRRTPG